MHKLQLTIHDPAGKVQYDALHTAPSSWKEFTRKHLMSLAAVLSSKQKIAMAELLLAVALYELPGKLFICIGKADRMVLRNSTRFALQRNELSDWLIPSIWKGLFRYHGPKNRLANLTVHEFSRCEQCYEGWAKTNNIEYLETLTAILYRPQRLWGVDDDIRVPLTTHGYIKRAKRFKKLPQALKVAIYLNYEGCRNTIHGRFKGIFEASSTSSAKAKPQSTPWAKIIEAGSNDIFGSHETTKQTLLYDFLSRLETRIKEMKDLEGKS